MSTNKFPVRVENLNIAATNQPTLQDSQDPNLSRWNYSFPHGSETRLHFGMLIPGNYSGGTSGVTVRLRWRSPVSIAGNVSWKLYGVSSATVTSNTPVQLIVNTAVSGTAGFIVETTITIATSSGYTPAANDPLFFCIARDGATGADTSTGTAELLEFVVEWGSVNATITKGYIWVTPECMVQATASNVTMAAGSNPNLDSAAIIKPSALQYPDSGTPTSDFKLNLPSNYKGNLKYYVLYQNSATGGANSFLFHLDMAASSIGSSSDPVLTAQANQALTNAAANFCIASASIAAVINPLSSQEIFCRLSRDIADTNTGSAFVFGVLFEYDLVTKNPNQLKLDPGSASLPTASPATVAIIQETNTAKQVGQFANAVDTCLDYGTFDTSLFQTTGSFRIRWTSSAAAGNIKLRVDYAYGATGATSDPALTVGNVATATTNGANLVNETVVTIPTGAAASNSVNIRLWRLGTLDTLAASINVLELTAEINT